MPKTVSQASESESTVNLFNRLHRYWNLLKTKWWILLLFFSVGISVAAYNIYTTPLFYSSVGKMIINTTLNIPGVTGLNDTARDELYNFYGTQIALMKSEVVWNRARARLKVEKPEIQECEVKIQVSQVPRSAIFTLQTLGEHPGYTQEVLNTAMEEYIAYKNEITTSTSSTALSSITEELLRLESELRKYEEGLHEFQKDNNVVVLEEQGNNVSRYLVNLNTQVAELKTEYQLLELLNLEQNLERLNNKEKLSLAVDGSSPAFETDYFKAKHQIQLLKAELFDWAQYMKPKHPKIVALNSEILRQEKLLEAFKQQSADQLLRRQESIKYQIQNLESVIKDWEQKSLDISKRMGEYQKIKTKIQRNQSLYDRLLNTVQTADVNQNIKQERIVILEQASKPKLVKTTIIKEVVIYSALGLFSGVFILLFLDRIDDRLMSFSELERNFEESLLGQIPSVKKANRENLKEFLDPDEGHHAFAEAFRNLRSALLFMNNEQVRPKTIMVTSAIPGEGKSTISMNLALTLAKSGSRVLLIDADLRRGVLHEHFSMGSTPGLADCLVSANFELPVIKSASENLYLLPRGGICKNPGELLLSERMGKLLSEFKASFDYIIIDSAPVLAADDSSNVADKIDGTIFVIRAAHTPSRVAKNALNQLYQRNNNILGLVLNAVNTKHREYYYYKYSNYYCASETNGNN